MWIPMHISHRDQLNYRMCLDILLEFIHQDENRHEEDIEIRPPKEYNLFEFQIYLAKKIWNRNNL